MTIETATTSLGTGEEKSLYCWTGQAQPDAGSVDTTLNEFVLGKSSLARDGDSVQFEFWGTFSGNTGVQITLLADSSTLMDTGVIDPGNESWLISGRFIRLSSSVQKSYATFQTKGTALSLVLTSDTTLVMSSTVTFHLNGLQVDIDDLKLTGAYYTLTGRPS